MATTHTDRNRLHAGTLPAEIQPQGLTAIIDTREQRPLDLSPLATDPPRRSDLLDRSCANGGGGPEIRNSPCFPAPAARISRIVGPLRAVH
jgi:hypothetical protein